MSVLPLRPLIALRFLQPLSDVQSRERDIRTAKISQYKRKTLESTEAFSKNHQEMESGHHENVYVKLNNVKHKETAPKVWLTTCVSNSQL
jgi:hypothetical protein